MVRLRILVPVLLVFALLAGGLSGSAQSDDDSRRQENPGYIVQGMTPGKPGDTAFLTGPRQGNPRDIAMQYLQQNLRLLSLTGADLRDLVITDQYTDQHNGVTHVYMRQRFNGIEVANGNLNINIASDGSVINVGHSFVSNLAAAVNRESPGRSASQSVNSAAQHLGLRPGQELRVIEQRGGPAQEVLFNEADISQEPILARLVYQPVAQDRVRLGWEIRIYELSGDHYWSMVVDAENGNVLAQHDYVDQDNWGKVIGVGSGNRAGVLLAPQASFAPANDGAAYNVFALPKESPSDGPRTLEVNPANANASPFGWHDTNGAAGPEFTITRGNNVHAYTDIDANNIADPGSSPDGGPTLQFDFPLDLTLAPPGYRPAAVTNLFYWNNIIHDVFYEYGFNEASGNFQVNNYGKGGSGNDDVRAEAQDGSGTNNANFATPADGFRPRMQMFVWNPPVLIKVTVNNTSIAGDYSATGAAFGPPLATAGPINADVALALDPADAVGPSATDACSPLSNSADIAGKIALLDRGSCTFVIKVKNAQDAGAVGVIVANNVAGAPITMGGADPTITIPSVMVSLANGNLFKGNLPFNATLSDPGGANINRDSDLDNGVIIHEYGHGISNRLTGGPNVVSCLGNQEQMGEGWSDWLALVLTTHPSDTAATRRGIASYLVFEPVDGTGIRPTPYSKDMSINPATYDTIKTAAVPHGVGYVWSTMLWDVYWNLVEDHGYNPDVYGHWSSGGNNLAIQLVMDGMKLQACSPGFVTGRNAILQADMVLTGGANQCSIWEGFARRGLGFSAVQGSTNSATDGTQAFDLPASCSPTLTLDQPAQVQYSDPVYLSASVAPLLHESGSVEFFINGVSVGTSAVDSNGFASLTLANERAAGNYNVTATFTPAGTLAGNTSSDSKTLVILKENATASYTGDQFVTTAGPNSNTAPVVLSANLVQESDGYPGDLSLATVVFKLFKSSNNGPVPDLVVAGVPVNASGKATTNAIIGADNWTVKVKVETGNSYWTSPVDTSTLTVVISSTDRRVTGGGWVPDSNSADGKGHFGFTVFPQKNGNPKGNSVFIFDGGDGFDYVVKSTSWQGGSLVFLGNPVTRARFTGRATVQKIDQETGEIVDAFGNYTFTVEIRDGNLLNPVQPDRYGITVWDTNGNIFHQVGGVNAPVETGGGNVAIKGN